MNYLTEIKFYEEEVGDNDRKLIILTPVWNFKSCRAFSAILLVLMKV